MRKRWHSLYERTQRVHILGCIRRKGKNIFHHFLSLVCTVYAVNVSQVESVFRRALKYSGVLIQPLIPLFHYQNYPLSSSQSQFKIFIIIESEIHTAYIVCVLCVRENPEIKKYQIISPRSCCISLAEIIFHCNTHPLFKSI